MNEYDLTALRTEQGELSEHHGSLTAYLKREAQEMRASGDAEGLVKLEAAEAELWARLGEVERLLSWAEQHPYGACPLRLN